MSVRTITTVLAVGTILVSTACSTAKDDGGAPPTGGSSAAPFEGTWTGTWTRVTPVGGGGTLTMVLHQQGTAITGTHTATGGACDLDGNLTGTANGNTITLKVVKGTGHREYTGTLSGSTLSGSLTGTCPAGVGTGTWQITREATGTSAKGMPSDICGLLTTAQAATVVRDTIKVSVRPAETNSGITNASCTWDSLSDKLTVTFVSGIPKEQSALSLQAQARDNNGQAVAGLGDQAYVFSSIPADAEVDLLVGDLYVTVELIRTGASGLHDQVVTLARAIVAKL
jgi:hypothetical protein